MHDLIISKSHLEGYNRNLKYRFLLLLSLHCRSVSTNVQKSLDNTSAQVQAIGSSLTLFRASVSEIRFSDLVNNHQSLGNTLCHKPIQVSQCIKPEKVLIVRSELLDLAAFESLE